ncbi:hypothetical protein BDA96_10G159900 [Sorghum bicolor]|uniref:Uncharacterized protein n=1 Tax=Sorghum bicolor TaxID=4558 RepID=A0A921U0V7_SORBI|nr:hypothetical protein BDA96_10G159900 [Sorghum bicolor]
MRYNRWTSHFKFAISECDLLVVLWDPLMLPKTCMLVGKRQNPMTWIFPSRR